MCEGCSDRNEVRCPVCRGALERARATPKLEAWCGRCQRTVRRLNGTMVVQEEAPSEPPVRAPRVPSPRPTPRPPLPVGRSLRVKRGDAFVKDGGLRTQSSTRALELTRGPRPSREDPMLQAVASTLFGVGAAVFLWMIYFAGTGPQGPESAKALALWSAAIVMGFTLIGAVSGSFASARERRRAARGLYRRAGLRIGPGGLEVDGESPIELQRVLRVRVENDGDENTLTVRTTDGEERVLLAGLDEAEATIVQNEIRAALRLSD